MSVYVVLEHMMQQSRVVAVFDSKEKANDFVKNYSLEYPNEYSVNWKEYELK